MIFGAIFGNRERFDAQKELELCLWIAKRGQSGNLRRDSIVGMASALQVLDDTACCVGKDGERMKICFGLVDIGNSMGRLLSITSKAILFDSQRRHGMTVMCLVG